jgi:hypothetical protein
MTGLPTPRELQVQALIRQTRGLTDGEARRILDLSPPDNLAALEAQERERAIKTEAARQHQEWLNSDEGRAAQRQEALNAENREREEVQGAAALLRLQGVPATDVERMQQDDPLELLYVTETRERPVERRPTGSRMVTHDSWGGRPQSSTLPSTDDLEAQLRAAGELPEGES